MTSSFNDWGKSADGGSGFGRFELSQWKGVRWTGASSYLAVAAARPNVTVLTGHTVTRVTLDNSKGLAATGTQFNRKHFGLSFSLKNHSRFGLRFHTLRKCS